ncbi:hypothetical protein MKW92_034852 [Papaver armeniacum]|nr:hypothetical protein MKW92_034852 [Papaver armeniacum]
MKQRNNTPDIHLQLSPSFISHLVDPPHFFFPVHFFSMFCVFATNHTVGGSLGWYDNLMKPDVNYQKFCNHSVVQTYNVTTYKRCNSDDAEVDDTTEWSSADPSATAPRHDIFLSSDYDGEQCKHGQHFKINVLHGSGLPPSMKTPSASEPSPSPTKSASGDDDDADDSTPNPDTVVSSNFNDPKQSTGNSTDDADIKESSSSVSITKSGSFLDMKMVTGIFLMVILGGFSVDI